MLINDTKTEMHVASAGSPVVCFIDVSSKLIRDKINEKITMCCMILCIVCTADRPDELPVPFHGQGQYSHQVGMTLTPGVTPINSGLTCSYI